MAIIFLLFSIALPLIIKGNIKSSYKSKSTPHSDNTDLWAAFPGKLNTTLLHTFQFYSYENESSPSLNESMILEEKVNYSNFEFDAKTDIISFTANKTHNLVKASTFPFTLPSLGLYEVLETLSNPPLYQKGINAISYLFKKEFSDWNKFKRQLFTANYFPQLFKDQAKAMDTLLSYITNIDTRKSIMNDELYGMKNVDGFFKWTKLISEESGDIIMTKAPWLKDHFKLTSDEVNSLLGKNSFLFKLYSFFINYFLDKQLDCPDGVCNEILFLYQLIDARVTQSFGYKNYIEMSIALDKEFAPLDHSIEMKVFFDEVFTKPKDVQFIDVALSTDQINMLFDDKNYTAHNHTLRDPEYCVKLLSLNQTGDIYEAYSWYFIKSTLQLNFITDYVFKFLPNIFLNSHFTDNGVNYSMNQLAKTFTSLIQITLNKSFAPFSKNLKFYHVLLANLTTNMLDLSQDLCIEFIQPIVDDGKKTQKICSDTMLDMKSYESIKIWLSPYKCLLEQHKDCDDTVIENLINLAGISREQLTELYSDWSLGLHIQAAEAILTKKYNFTPDQYAIKQFTESYITWNPPIESAKKSESAYYWDPIEYPEQIELYLDQKTCEKISICTEKANQAVMSLYNTIGTILDSDHANELYSKEILEKVFVLYMNGITNSQIGMEVLKVQDIQKFLGTIKQHIKRIILKNSKTAYEGVDVLYGNFDNDRNYLEILRNGSYIDNYKPGIEKTTGFKWYLAKEKNYDKYSLHSSRIETTKQLRGFVKINDFGVLNFKKREYSDVSKTYKVIEAPLYSLAKVSGTKWISDGFQYAASLDTIYYYDALSSRVFEFTHSKNSKYNDIKCKRYLLNVENIPNGYYEENDKDYMNNTNFALASQMFNKPILISKFSENIIKDNKYTPKSDTEYVNDNFICVDSYSNMVIKSNFSLLYSIYSKDFSYVDDDIKNKAYYPILKYSRTYEVTKESYFKALGFITVYYSLEIAWIVIGTLLVLACIALAIYAFIWHNKQPEQDIGIDVAEDPLISASNRMSEV